MEREYRRPRIVVGLDGSDGSTRALRWAIHTARGLGAEIVAVHVDSVPAYLPVPLGVTPPTSSTEWHEDLQRAFTQDWCAPLQNAGVGFRAIVEEATPAASALIQVAEREAADMIVVGSRGLGGFAELLLGSVGHQLVHHSPIPVVIVPRAVKARAKDAQPTSEVVLRRATFAGVV